MAVTIKELSIHCGLSVSTVSKALNDYPDVSEETKQQVRAAADELGYRPSAIARSLKIGRTFNLGVLYSDDTESGLTHSFFSPVLQSFKKEAERRGYDITFITHNMSAMWTASASSAATSTKAKFSSSSPVRFRWSPSTTFSTTEPVSNPKTGRGSRHSPAM